MAPKGFSDKQDFLDSLTVPDSEVVQAFVYFSPELWPRISKLIQDHLQTKGVFCTVANMVENDKQGFYNPWIVIRVIPSSKDMITKDIKKEVKDLMLENGLNNPIYKIWIDPGKRAARPSAIETELNQTKLRSYSADQGLAEPTKDAIRTPEVLSVSTNLPNLLFDKTLFDKALNVATGKGMEKNEFPRSVKHLTCWYWSNHPNGCIKSAEGCSYAHVDTGRYAEKPRAVIPGGPRLAGRNANRIEATLRDGLAMHLGMDAPANAAAAAAALDAEKSKGTSGSTTSADEAPGSRLLPSFSLNRDGVAIPITSHHDTRPMASVRPFGSIARGMKGAFLLEPADGQARSAATTTQNTASPGSNATSDNNSNGVPLQTPAGSGTNTANGTPTKTRRPRNRHGGKNKWKQDFSFYPKQQQITYNNQLLLNNHYANQACRELCIGLDFGKKELQSVLDKTSALHNALISLNSTLDTGDDIDTARAVKGNLDALATDTKATLDLLAMYRGRAENFLGGDQSKTARNVFRWWDQVDRARDAESTVALAEEFDVAATTTTTIAGGRTASGAGYNVRRGYGGGGAGETAAATTTSTSGHTFEEDDVEGGVGLNAGIEVGKHTGIRHGGAPLAIRLASGGSGTLTAATASSAFVTTAAAAAADADDDGIMPTGGSALDAAAAASHLRSGSGETRDDADESDAASVE